jgi:hypothetical protein
MVHLDIPNKYTSLLTFLAWYIYMTPHFPGTVHIYHPSLSCHGTYTYLLTLYVLGIWICIMPGKWGVMYIYHARKVRSHVYICTMPGKWGVMYMYHARKVRSHVYVPCQENEEWCIFVRYINMYHTRKMMGDVHHSLTWLATYIYMTPHFPGMIYIHHPSLSWHGTYWYS